MLTDMSIDAYPRNIFELDHVFWKHQLSVKHVPSAPPQRTITQFSYPDSALTSGFGRANGVSSCLVGSIVILILLLVDSKIKVITGTQIITNSNTVLITMSNAGRTMNLCSNNKNHCSNNQNHCSNNEKHCRNTENHCRNNEKHCCNNENHCCNSENHCGNKEKHRNNVENPCSSKDNHCSNNENLLVIMKAIVVTRFVTEMWKRNRTETPFHRSIGSKSLIG